MTNNEPLTISPDYRLLVTIARDSLTAACDSIDTDIARDFISDDSADDHANATDFAAYLLSAIRFADNDEVATIAAAIRNDDILPDSPFDTCIHFTTPIAAHPDIPTTCSHDEL